MNNLELFNQPQFIIILLWNLFWKGLALWKSSQKRQLGWFVLLFVVNTFGILEIAYIFFLNKWDLDKGKLLKFLENKFGKQK